MLEQLMKRNRREREEERRHEPDMIDSRMMWFLMNHLRRTRRARVRCFMGVHSTKTVTYMIVHVCSVQNYAYIRCTQTHTCCYVLQAGAGDGPDDSDDDESSHRPSDDDTDDDGPVECVQS